MMDPHALVKQLDELQIIQCSLLPGELFTFMEGSEDWNELLEAHPTATTLPNWSLIGPAHIQIRVIIAKVWFEITVPPQYVGNAMDVLPTFTVKGENLTRHEQERWHHIIEEKLAEIADTEYPIYQLISLHLLPLLHTELDSQLVQSPINNPTEPTQIPDVYHALLTSHHLISPNKRRSLQNWSASLSITGFAKVGYPGVIYAQGQRENVEEFVANIKAMQWLALRVRFIEPLEDEIATADQKRRWNEFHKVGEVVEEMRRLGREQFVIEMGIGNAGTK